METENKILKYIHLQMNETEKQAFEQELNNNPELKAEVDFWLNYVLAEKLYGKDGFKQKIEQSTDILKKNNVFKKAEKEYQKQRKFRWLKISIAACISLMCFFYFWKIYLPKEKQKQIAQKTLEEQKPANFFESSLEFVDQIQGFTNIENQKDIQKLILSGQCDSLKTIMSENSAAEGILFFYYTGCGYMENESLSLQKLAGLANSENSNLRLYSRYYLALFYLIQEENEDQAFTYLREIAKQNDILELQNAAQEVLGSLEKI